MALTLSSLDKNTSYNVLNAVDIKEYIISQLENSGNEAFKDVRYAGSNMNAFVDTIAVMLQQILFHFSLNASEATFSQASLYESMNKLVSILNYKTIGKQTSMLPVRITCALDQIDAEKIVIPRFLTIEQNAQYILKNEIVKNVDSVISGSDNVVIDTVMFQGSLNNMTPQTAKGDEYETFILEDTYINKGQSFISDNFFVVFVKDAVTGKYKEYKETTSLYLEDEYAEKYERRFNERYNYEFKFGNGVYGKKLNKNDEVIIFYLVSSGESAIVSNNIIVGQTPEMHSSAMFQEIQSNLDETQQMYADNVISNEDLLQSLKVSSTGDSTPIAYPESVESIRANAPKIFASQNRLFSLNDFKAFIMKNFAQFCKDIYMMTNDSYTSYFLKYYYNIGLIAPQKDARINLAQVEFQTSCNFNNVYAVIVPNVNTVISGKIPNYVNTSLKQEIIQACEPYKGITHNLVILDAIYKAVTFGSFNLSNENFNTDQLKTKLVLKRASGTKYSYTYIKDEAISIIKDFFDRVRLGDDVDLSSLSKSLLTIAGVKSFVMRDINDKEDERLTLYTWNPLYSNEDNLVTQQTISSYPFQYHYFYDIDNIENLILVEDE